MTQLRHHFDHSTPLNKSRLPQQIEMQASAAAICASAYVETPDGPRAAGRLRCGDTVLDRDGFPHRLHWVGHANLSTEILNRSPELRPVRISACTMPRGTPTDELHISPAAGLVAQGPDGHKLLKAREFASMGCAIRAVPRNGITYVHLMCDSHIILRVNGIEVESFHPAALTRSRNTAAQLAGIIGVFPDLEHGIDLYGPPNLPAFDWSQSN